MGFLGGVADYAQIGPGAILGVRASGNHGTAVTRVIGTLLDPKSARSRSESGMCTRGVVRGVLQVGSWRSGLWQNNLNYPGSSAQAITIKATPAQTHFKRNNPWSVG